jgi:hypothetical protein
MPDTTIQSSTPAPSPCGVLSDYRSPLIGQLVAARAKAASEIKRVIKDKTADIPAKSGTGRSYSYSYADLASVMEAVDDALAAQEMALFQTMVDRRGAVFLVTTLAHSSDQWISSEVRVGGIDAGPQVFGSALTYMRRYSALSILGIAAEADDDGQAAQERADRCRQEPQERSKPAKRPMPTTKPAQATQQESAEPQYMAIPVGVDGPLIGRWTKIALEKLAGRPESWRRAWLSLHAAEMTELRCAKPDYADRIDAAIIAPDFPERTEIQGSVLQDPVRHP